MKWHGAGLTVTCLVCLIFAATAGSAHASGHARSGKSLQLSLTSPGGGTEGEPIGLRAKARPGKRFGPIVSVSLNFGDGSAVLRGRSLLKHPVSHVYTRSGTYTAKLVVTGKRHRQRSVSKVVTIGARSNGSGPGPGPGPGTTPAPAEDRTDPAPPLELTARALEIAPGSTVPVELPGPLTQVSAVSTVSGAPAGVTASAFEEGVQIAADAEVSPQAQTLTVTGVGCAGAECEREFVLRVPLTVGELAAPPGEVDSFTTASPDRIAEGEDLPTGGVRLRDELLVTFGTPDAPGDRSEAEEAAEEVGAVVSGGIEAIGVYEFRWEAPQDLEQIKQELLGRSGVTAVSDSTVDDVGTDAVPPGDWSDDGPQATWSFTQVRAPQAWDTSTGSDVGVGIVDEGQVFGGHEDLNVTKKLGSRGPALHATHVAGIACAKANGIGVVGFAWGCPITTSGIADTSEKSWLAAATAVAEQPGVGVINMSLGRNHAGCATTAQQNELLAQAAEYKTPFRELFRGPIGRDIVWTISAGNNCAAGVPSGMGLNSDLGNVITVAATNSDGSLARFSDFGPGVEVAAPGGVSVSPIGDGTVGIWSTTVESCYKFFHCGSYAANLPDGWPIMGTSMAAPAVAGIAALVRSTHPDYGASRAAGCIVGDAGTNTGMVASRSSFPFPTKFSPQVSYPANSLPIVDAQAAVACDNLSFDGSPGTGPPPATLGPYTMTAFGPDSRPEGESVDGVSDPAGTIGFSPDLSHRRVPNSWATWSHGYTGDVYFTETESTVTMTLPAGTKAFAFYAEPNTFDSFTVEAIAQDGTSSEPVDIQGYAGARYFGFYGTGTQTVASIEITASDPAGFAVGEFQIAR